MKKLILLFTAAAVIAGFSYSEAGDKLNVVTTTTDLASLAEYIGGDKVNAISLSRPMQDAHYLNATPGMVARISRSDVFIQNGLDLEMGWIPEVITQTRNRQVRHGGAGYINAGDGLQAIQIPERIHRDMGDVHPSGNPHYTLEPVRTQQAARNIASGFMRVDSADRDYYQRNLDRYIQQSNAVVAKWKKKFEPYRGAGVIIYHKHFDYLLLELGLDIVDAIEPLPGLAPSAGHIAGLLSKYSSDDVKLVMMEPWHDERVGRRVAEGIGVELVIGCPAVGGCDGAKDILSLFETNASMILEALKKADR